MAEAVRMNLVISKEGVIAVVSTIREDIFAGGHFVSKKVF
jgi:hypothetical protein